MKNFLKGRKLKSRYFLLGGLFLAAAYLAIPQHVWAVPWYLNPAVDLFSSLFGSLLKVLLQLANALLGWMTQAVGWAIGNPFNISYTRPGITAPDNFIIEIGWTLLRDLVNMGFILGLAYIGLSTALDFNISKGQFATNKTFFNLILIALLINFTPAICGAVVDMGNIMGSFFTQGTDFSTINEIFNRQESKLSADWTNILTEGTTLLNAVVLIAFGFFAALILGIYFILFCARGPIIWILVIFSPVAFFAYIFDKTRKEFSKWWDMFIQWALMMPIILGFFLYLSQQILVRVNEIMNASGSSPSGFINQIVPYALPLGFLALGLFLGTSKLMPAGGGALVGMAKTGGVAALGAAGAGVALAGKKTASGTRNLYQRLNEENLKPGEAGYDTWKNQNWRNKTKAAAGTAGRFMFGGATKEERAQWNKKGGGTLRVGRELARAGLGAATLGATYWANPLAQRVGRKLNSAVEESTSKDIADNVGKLKGKSVVTKEKEMKNALPGVLGRKRRVSAMIAAIEDGDDLKDYKHITRLDKKEIIKDTIKYAREKMSTIKNIDPLLTAEVAGQMALSERSRKQTGVYLDDKDKEKYQGYYKPMAEGAIPLNVVEQMKATGYAPDQFNEYEKSLKKGLSAVQGQIKGEQDNPGSTGFDVSQLTESESTIKAKLDAIKEATEEFKLDPVAAKLIAEIKPNKMNAWTSDVAESAAVSDIANKFWSGAQAGKAAEQFGNKFIETFNKNIKPREWYAKENPKLGNYLKNNTALAAGFGNAIFSTEKPLKIESDQLEAQLEKMRADLKEMQPASSPAQKLAKEIRATSDRLEKMQNQTAGQPTTIAKPGGQTKEPTPGATSANTINSPETPKPTNIFSRKKTSENTDDKPLNLFKTIKSGKKNDKN